MLLDAIDLREELGVRFAQGASVNALGFTYVLKDDSRRAARFCSQALRAPLNR